MLLGYEFTLLSRLFGYYHRNDDGIYRFTLQDYKENFDDEVENYLDKLSTLSIISINGKQIELDSLACIQLFIERLNVMFLQVDNKVKAKFKDAYTLDFEYDSQFLVSFDLKFNNIEDIKNKNSIIFCDSYYNQHKALFWLDLLNDELFVEHLYYFLMKKFTYFVVKNLRRIDFLSSLDKEYLDEIFYNSLPKFYEKQKYFINRNIELSTQQILKKCFHQDNLEAIEYYTESDRFIVLKLDSKLFFLALDNENIKMYSSKKLDELENKLLKKISKLSKLTMSNKYQIFGVFDKGFKSFWFFITAINALLLFINTRSITVLQNIIINPIILYIGVFSLITLAILTFIFYTLPAIKLSLFNWDL